MFAFENAGRVVLDPFADHDLAADVHEIEHPADGVARGRVGQFLLAAAEPLERIQGRGFAGADKIEFDDAFDVVVFLAREARHGSILNAAARENKRPPARGGPFDARAARPTFAADSNQTYRIMEWLSDPNAWIGLLTLTLLEIVLGIDNIIFISILSGKLPVEQQKKARQLGLALAMIMRILLLLSLSWIIGLTQPLFSLLGFEVTGRAIILIGGGLFLIAKSTHEIHNKLEGEDQDSSIRGVVSFSSVLIQIILLDIVFSLDSVITAVGMVDEIAVMVAAVIIAVGVMMVFAGTVSNFVERHPTIKMLALSFLLLIGVNLIGEGLGFHIPKGYTYFAMGFAVFVELLNIKLRRKAEPVKLHNPLPRL